MLHKVEVTGPKLFGIGGDYGDFMEIITIIILLKTKRF